MSIYHVGNHDRKNENTLIKNQNRKYPNQNVTTEFQGSI